jgi:hypothetical protein
MNNRLGQVLTLVSLAALLSLSGTREARAETALFYQANGAVAVVKGAIPSSPHCKDYSDLWQDFDNGENLSPFELQCLEGYEAAGVLLTLPLPSTQTSGPHVAHRAILRYALADAAGTPALSLSLSTPYAPFLGNRFVINQALDAANPANATTAYAIALRRQSDCSLTEDFLNVPSASTPNGVGVLSVNGAQDYLHQLAGLTTTPDVFAGGCGFPTLGQPTTTAGVLLGQTPSGNIFSASSANGLLITLLNPTANSFTDTPLIGSSAMQGGVAAADLNGDGNFDIVATWVTDPNTHQFATAVLLGNGDGTFQAPAYYGVAGDVTIDDVNGDGKADIVVVSGPGVTTLVGNGNGSFTVGASSATTLGLTALAATAQVLSGDFNNDGKRDLLVDVNGTMTVLLGVGDGTFTVGSPVSTDPTVAPPYSVPSVAVGDMNNDGKADVVISQPGFVAIFYGNGNGAFTAGPRYAALPDYRQVSLTDLDGDGHPDIVLGTASGGIYTSDGYDLPLKLFQVLMSRGDGTFVDSLTYNAGAFNDFNSTFAGQQIASADFNGDGKPDVLVLRAGGLSVLPGDGNGNLGTAITSATTLSGGAEFAVTDVNGDTKPDVVLAGGSALAVLIGQSNGTFSSEQDYALPNTAVSVAVGDFNGDGLKDVAVGVAGGGGPHGVYVLLGQSNGTLGAPVQIDSSLDPVGLAAGDLNGDNRTDLIVADEGDFSPGTGQQVNGALHVYLGKGDGTFTNAAAPTTNATNYSTVALGDLNADGKLDLVVGGNGLSAATEGTPNVYSLLGNGDGTFQTAKVTPLVSTDGVGPNAISLGDVNKDGKLDVVASNFLDFTEVLAGNGDGTFASTVLTLGQRQSALTLADLNGDGFPELLTGAPNGSAVGNSLTVLLNANAWAAAVSAGAATTTALSISPNPVTVGQTATLTATVASSASGTPTGTVSFLDGSTSLGSAPLSAQGIATLTSAAFAAGSHSVTAHYGGDSNFGGSTSNAVALTVNAAAPDFSLSASAASGTATAGQSVTTTLTVTPAGGFNSAVTLACSGLPTGATCSFSPSSVTPNGGAATSMLTIASSARMAAAREPTEPWLAGGLLLAGLALPISVRRRRAARAAYFHPALALLLIATAALHGCGGGGSSSGSSGGSSTGTPAGTYTVTITATAGSISHSVTYTLTIG